MEAKTEVKATSRLEFTKMDSTLVYEPRECHSNSNLVRQNFIRPENCKGAFPKEVRCS